jgi:hypothetical protein
VPNVYSKRLAEVAFSPLGPAGIGTPPAGHKWVVKDMRATLSGGKAYPVLGFKVTDTVGVPLWEVTQPFAVTSYSFGWEGSQVVEYGEGLTLVSGEAGWALRVSGYELVLP